MKRFFLHLTALSFVVINAQNKPLDSVQKLDEIVLQTNVIFGNKYQAQNRTGSSYYLSPKELKKFNYTVDVYCDGANLNSHVS